MLTLGAKARDRKNALSFADLFDILLIGYVRFVTFDRISGVSALLEHVFLMFVRPFMLGCEGERRWIC